MKLCRNGLHDLDDPLNVYVRPSGKRQCHPCVRAAMSKRNAERRLADPEFRQRENLRAEKWAADNPERAKANADAWRAKNREKVAGYSRADYAKHRDKRKASAKEWRDANRQQMNELVAAWGKANPDRRADTERRRRARKAGTVTDGHSRSEVLLQWGSDCWMCGETLDLTNWHEDHVVPLVLGGTDLIDNCKPACPPCNIGKGGRMFSNTGGSK